jgi:hypothetical protein
MPANGAVYIQRNDVNLSDVFKNVKSNKGIFRKATYFEVSLDGEIVRFNIMEPSTIQNHINGFLGYISSLNQSGDNNEKAKQALSHTKVVLGLETDKEFEDNQAIWQSLFKIAQAYDGLVFAHGSVLLPNGEALVEPAL